MQTETERGRSLWLEARRRGIGGTDAAAILGLSRYATPLHVWLEKQGEPLSDDRSDEWLWWGRKLEPLIAERFSAMTSHQLWKPDGIREHPEHPCLIGTFDYLLTNVEAGLECKTSRTSEDWGEAGTDEVPAPYVVQCQHYMAISGFPVWYVAVLIGGSDFRVYRVVGDSELQHFIASYCADWWQRHVVGEERPEIDGHPGTARWLADRFPKHGSLLRRAPPEAEPIVRDLSTCRAVIRGFEDRRAGYENALKEMIGESPGIEGEGWRVTWKRSRDRVTVDWEAVARELWSLRAMMGTYDDEHFAEVIGQRTARSPGSRRFLMTLDGSGESE